MFTMAPLALQPYSCVHCQNIVVDLNGSGRRRDDASMATRSDLFHCTFKDVKTGAEIGCEFCARFMDNEYTVQMTFLPIKPTGRYWMHCRIWQCGLRIFGRLSA